MNSLNILVVEDDVLVAADIRKTLEKAGYQIMATARSFKEALAAVKRQMPDIVLLDIELQGSADGIAVAKEILQQQQIPIIVLTASTEDKTYERAKLVFNPAGYITKPFRQVDLPRLVDLAWQNFRPDKVIATSALQDTVFLPVDKHFEKIVKSEIIYIVTQKGTHCVFVYEMYKKGPRLIQLSMGHLEQYFDLPCFYRLSRSLLINLSCIERIEGNQLRLQDQPTLFTIPEASRADLVKHLAIVRGPKR